MNTPWSGEKIFPLFEEDQRDAMSLVRVSVVDDNQPVQVVVQRRESDGTWIDSSTEVEIQPGESTELLVEQGVQRLLINEVSN